MKAGERRERILEYFRRQTGPVSASALAAEFSVSRQIIVGVWRCARLRVDMTPTPRGYILKEKEKKGIDPPGGLCP